MIMTIVIVQQFRAVRSKTKKIKGNRGVFTGYWARGGDREEVDPVFNAQMCAKPMAWTQ